MKSMQWIGHQLEEKKQQVGGKTKWLKYGDIDVYYNLLMD